MKWSNLTKIVIVLSLVLVAALATARQAAADHASQQSSEVRRTSDGSVVPDAWSTLRRGERGISMTLQTSELPAGHAFTVWWIIFNNPKYCTTGLPPYRCGMADLFAPQVEASVLRAAGHVIGQDGVGNFAGHLAVGDTREVVRDPSGNPMGNGLSNPQGADVHLIVRDHGPADPAMVERQIHTVWACNPACYDQQFSVHEHR